MAKSRAQAKIDKFNHPPPMRKRPDNSPEAKKARAEAKRKAKIRKLVADNPRDSGVTLSAEYLVAQGLIQLDELYRIMHLMLQGQEVYWGPDYRSIPVLQSEAAMILGLLPIVHLGLRKEYVATNRVGYTLQDCWVDNAADLVYQIEEGLVL